MGLKYGKSVAFGVLGIPSENGSQLVAQLSGKHAIWLALFRSSEDLKPP